MDFKLRRHSKFLFWLLKKILKYPTSEKRDCSDMGLCILQKVKSFECSIFGSIVEKTRNYKRRFSIPCESFFSTRFNSTRKVWIPNSISKITSLLWYLPNSVCIFGVSNNRCAFRDIATDMEMILGNIGKQKLENSLTHRRMVQNPQSAYILR